jgi:hypothetical protein
VAAAPNRLSVADPLCGRQLDLLDRAPRSTAADEFGLLETDHGLGQGIVVGVAPGTNRADRARLGETLGVAVGRVTGSTGGTKGRLHSATGDLPPAEFEELYHRECDATGIA